VKGKIHTRTGRLLLPFALAAGCGSTPALGNIAINTVAIGNAGNTAASNGYGGVAYAYNIGAGEVTNAQYAAFLNAKAANDAYGLYNPNMYSPLGGIGRTGSAGSYQYFAMSGRENHPVIYVSFWDACRFANWLHNGQGNGDTETGAYTLGGVTNPVNASVTRNAGWQWAVTSESEWYKAAYHQPASAGGDTDDYWLFPTSSNSISTAQANYANAAGGTTAAGSYAANFYGTFDMGGNVAEWNEAIMSSSTRGTRGGHYFGLDIYLRADQRFGSSPATDFANMGFRVVQIPAPAVSTLLALGLLRAGGRKRDVRS
jgi:formylglycine-generating enzyme